ncbi:hypothetical protein [Citrobacter freundii]|uniref:Uncharacterized protein n=1 Tax=Citrobacter freundii TaxID=546 RepID=A0A7G2IPX6_CITFR|nr:hypothetical protein [Citrobacter freundii]
MFWQPVNAAAMLVASSKARIFHFFSSAQSQDYSKKCVVLQVNRRSA